MDTLEWKYGENPDLNLFDDQRSGALISECKRFRYKLWRIWDETKPRVLFIMLNPSTADHNTDDNTIRRCMNYAKSWGYGGIMVGNLYAFRATEPKDLFRDNHDINPTFNDPLIQEMIPQCEIMIYAWGAHGMKNSMGKKFIERNPNGYYLELTKKGIPKHPLYLLGDLIPKKYSDI